MKLTLGFSPCPNDTFIFDALVNKKIDIGDFEFEVVLEDVQTLNECALEGKLDISKVSYGALTGILSEYIVLNSGGALGKGAGPLLITKYDVRNTETVDDMLVAVPGKNTTAHVLFSMAFPQVKQKKFMVFSAIEDAVLNGEVDAGVIIHENRFTYEQKGLKKIMDLGEFWELQTGYPIPLGGIVMRREFDEEVRRRVDELIKESLAYAFSNYPDISEYVKEHAQEMDEKVMRQHIDLYVNNYSLQLGNDGRAAIQKFLSVLENSTGKRVQTQEIFSYAN
jgi:1,4-dihydroxy-6-naphthoate synthase